MKSDSRMDLDTQYVADLLNNCSYAELSPITPVCSHKDVDSIFCRDPENCTEKEPFRDCVEKEKEGLNE